jgi:hypothetical protein
MMLDAYERYLREGKTPTEARWIVAERWDIKTSSLDSLLSVERRRRTMRKEYDRLHWEQTRELHE